MPRHVRKGDVVIVTSGASRGVVGEILRVVDEGERVVVKGAAMRTRHVKPTQQRPQVTIVKEEGTIHVSNVSPVVDGKPTRVRNRVDKDGTKERIGVKSGEVISRAR